MSKIQVTKNYRLFHNNSGENRPVEMNKHKRLVDSMKLYGFLQEFPIVCTRDSKGNLVVKDGQHRLVVAETLQLPVYWVEASMNWDVAVVNSTAKPWILRDYAGRFAANGNENYQEGLDFAERHRIPIGPAFALLAGTTTFTNCHSSFIDGTFKVKDRAWADSVASIYSPLVSMSKSVSNARFLEACMAVCRVPEFDGKRLLQNAERCREKLVSYSTRDAYLEMLEHIYNFGRGKLFALKIAAISAMRDRNAATVKKRKKEQRKLEAQSA